MNTEPDAVRQLFTEALAKPTPEERGRFLNQTCASNVELRRQVESLLRAHDGAGDFLQHSVVSTLAPVAEGPGSVVGRYKLLQQIGEGAFGVVFMAEQQEPVRRLVAVKILKAGLETKEIVARFEGGQQALALMDHPNLARVFDGGATPSGRPFFVMELIQGVAITEFCEQHRLSIPARIELFIKVCAAVQHAHQKGVIHRDLKPSNVLVTLHEGEAVPKVIDFGIAKAIGQKLTERTLFTRFEQLIGTPAYMSPEQAEWSGLDIDTRSDLYSLGVLLYELLTGTTPLEKETLARAALDELRRMIREVEPPRPSARLTTLADMREQAEDGGHRPEWRERLPLVRGDLDWIVMQCLEKDRTRRYETVNGLAQDLRRHLNREPVTACPPSKAYLAGKFIRKHRVAVAATTAVGLALVAGLVFALVGFTQARREKQRAQEEAAFANAVHEFYLNALIGQTGASTAESDLSLETILNRASAKLELRFLDSLARPGRGLPASLWEHNRSDPRVQRAMAALKEKLGVDDAVILKHLVEVLTENGVARNWTRCIDIAREISYPTNYIAVRRAGTYRGAIAALLAGDTAAFGELNARLLDQTVGTSNSVWARECIEIACLHPTGLVDAERLCALAELIPGDHGSMDDRLAKGMIEYRRGNLPAAWKWLVQARMPEDSERAIQASFFCAMVLQRQGDPVAARTELNEATRRLATFLNPDWLIERWDRWQQQGQAVVTRMEAERVILGKLVTPMDGASMLSSSRRRCIALKQGHSLAAEGRWTQAREKFVTFLQEPGFAWEPWEHLDREMPQRLAIVFLLAGDRQNFQKVCHDWFKRLEKRPNMHCILLAIRTAVAGETDLTTDLGRLTLTWVHKAEQRAGAINWTWSMITYRAGQYREAIQHAEETQSVQQPAIRLGSQIFRAMALAKSGRWAEGQQDFQEVEAKLRPHLATLQGDLWWDLGLCQLALEEARRLFDKEG